MSEYNRRSFLRTSFLGTSAAITAPSLLTKLTGSFQESTNKKTVIKRTLGKTGLVLPVVSMGVMRADSPALVRAALEAGIEHLDTANTYQKGRNEEMLGGVLKDIPRSSFVLATKVSPEEIDRQKDAIGSGSTKEAFLKRFEDSLRRLKLEYVDILYIHGLSSRDHVFNEQMMNAVVEAKKSGKARFIGISAHKNMEEVITAAVEAKIYDVVLAAMNFQYNDPQKLRAATAKAAEAGIGIVAMKTMAGGFFDKEKKKQVNCKAALKWVLEDPNVATCIPGMTTFDQLAENASVNYDITMTAEERTSLAMNNSDEGMYCDGCSECTPTCRNHLAIPEMMRAYMYAFGYGAPRLAKEVLGEIQSSTNPCHNCPECTADCKKGFPLRARIADVARLQSVPDEFLV